MDEPTFTPGEALRAERERTGVTVSELARVARVSRQTIHSWEASEGLDQIRTIKYRRALESARDRKLNGAVA